jgi:uncharacterized protein (DUF1800 family)
MQDTQIALNRFGLGAKPGEVPPSNPRGWLVEQLTRFNASPAAFAGLADTAAAVEQLAAIRRERRHAKQVPEQVPNTTTGTSYGIKLPDAMLFREPRDAYIAAASAHLKVAVSSDTPFVERLVAFWSNHFAVSIDKAAVIGLAGPFEREAIRPHVLGTFSDMLNAVERHPAMLLFLDQAQSVGPDSTIAGMAARRQANVGRKLGINENLGREIMELHTLGARSGYGQTDVTEFSRALTGWTMTGFGPFARRFGDGSSGKFAFVEQLHEPGTRTIMGKRYAQDGEAQAQAVLDDLAAHPATAKHIATKLARHFAGDNPPASLVTRLETAFTSSGGDLPTVYRALVEAPESWTPAPLKFRQPWEWTVAVMRGTGISLEDKKLIYAMNQLGQPLWKPGSPAGWDDTAASWASPDALLRRVDLAGRIGQEAGAVDARKLGDTLFGASLSDETRQSIARAESPAQALALLLVAPEMLRR